MTHVQGHEEEPVPGLPYDLPEGEHLLWQGRPAWRALARETFKLHWLAGYFLLMFCVRLGAVLAEPRWADGLRELALTVLWSVACLGLVALFAYLQARSSLYSITSRRVVMRIGVALPVTWNLPFKRLAAAQLANRGHQDGDIVLELVKPDRVAWLQFWPHTQPGHYFHARACLRAIPEPQRVATLLADAVHGWASQGTAPVSIAHPNAAPHHHTQTVPRGLLWAACGLMVASMALAAVSRAMHPAEEVSASALEERELRFEDRADGSLAVLDGSGQNELAVLPPGSNNFIRGVLRGLFRGRKLESLGRDGLFRLAREADGRLTLEDLQLGRRIDLDSFGPTNVAEFAEILAASSRAQDVRHAGLDRRSTP